MSVGKGLQKLPDNLFGLPVVRKHVSGAGKIETGPVKSPDHAESGLDIREEFSEGLFPEYDDLEGLIWGIPFQKRSGRGISVSPWRWERGQKKTEPFGPPSPSMIDAHRFLRRESGRPQRSQPSSK
jgi:hypothetical protein